MLKPATAWRLWLVLDAVTRDPIFGGMMSGEEWHEVSQHIAMQIPRCPHCDELLAEPLEHACPRAEPAIIV
jgi:hypothetical protein